MAGTFIKRQQFPINENDLICFFMLLLFLHQYGICSFLCFLSDSPDTYHTAYGLNIIIQMI